MAKILSVSLLSIPDVIHVGDNVSDITVVTEIQFHRPDIVLEMEYCLHIFVYDIHGDMDTPFVLPNWDESNVLPISLDRKDDFMGKAVKILKADVEKLTVEMPIALHLGKFNKERSYISRKLEAFATMAPAVGRASKWSDPFTSHIEY